MDKLKNILDPLPNMSKNWQPLIPYKHDRYLTPELLRDAVLNSERIQELCIQIANADKRKEKVLRAMIKDILTEIGLNHSLPLIRTLGICLNKIFHGMTSGVYVNQSSIDLVRQTLSGGECPVIYLPSHRSYADFILMSYICFVHDLEIPAIAAGMDFHAMFAMGTLLRFTGAFFMRRSFSTDKLYWNVFREYVHILMTQYHTGLEFFIEGTRSRSNKALSPKTGLLTMALEPYFNRKVYDVMIVPVGVAYDKILEEVLFVYELLGVPKPRESTLRFLRALNILNVQHGKMIINFGQPISLRAILESHKLKIQSKHPVNTGALLKEKKFDIIQQLAAEVINTQQKLMFITIFNLMATYFCYRRSIQQSTSISDIVEGIKLLQKFLKTLGANVAIGQEEQMETDILESLQIHSNVLKISQSDNSVIELVRSAINMPDGKKITGFKGHQLSTTTMYNTLPILLLQLYTNPCLYWLHVPAFYILAQSKTNNPDEIENEVGKLRRIFGTEFISDKSNTEEIERTFLSHEFKVSNANTNELNDIILSAIGPFFNCYLYVTEVILEMVNQKLLEFTEKELLTNVQKYVENKLENNSSTFIHPICLCLDTISNALHSFVCNKYVQKTYISMGSPKYTPSYQDIESLHDYLQNYCQSFQKFYFSPDNIVSAKL